MTPSKSLDPGSVSVLVVDNDEVILSVLEEQLQAEGLKILSSTSPVTALESLQTEKFSVILADHEMPEMPGLDFFAKVRDAHPNTTRVLLSSTLSLKQLCDAVKSDLIHRFLAKPWLREELLALMRNAAAPRFARTPSTSVAAAPVDQATAPTEGKASTVSAITTENADAAVEVFVKMLGTFHPNLGNTAIRAMALCRTIADNLELSNQEARNLVWAAGLHDIALVGVERAIVRRWLRSQDKCNEEELTIIRRHTKESEEMLKPWPTFSGAGEIIRCHHENLDGTGYPNRLKGETIPWLARLLSVAIYFCSRHQAPIQVMADIENQSGKTFDATAVEAVAKAVPMTQLPRGEREILLLELQPGMVLARDIYNTSGMLIIAKEKEMTNVWINKIQTINNATPINPLVLVYC